MIDSKCFRNISDFFKNINEININSKKVGITKLLTISQTPRLSLLFLIKFLNLSSIPFSFHPHDADKNLVTHSKK